MGPLQGLKVVEIAGIGPTQFCGMLLADMGATVLRVERPGGVDVGTGLDPEFNLMNRGRITVELDLKDDDSVQSVLELCRHADAIFEGFRPGVMESLGLGPDECLAMNPALVYGRMTGWGQTGPLANSAGHDGNYAALSGALGAIGGHGEPPAIPLNLVADFGGGGAYLAIGILAAMLESRSSGQGQVVDAAMVDGAASLMTLFYGLHAGGYWKDERSSNFLDGAAPFYRSYETRDGKYIVVCAIEPKFFRILLDTLGVDDIDPAGQFDQARWPEHRRILENTFRCRSRDEWETTFEGLDGCVSPVLSLTEAPAHAHNRERETFIESGGILQPAPAPRFSRTPSEIGAAPGTQTVETEDILESWRAPGDRPRA
jgi:alpha-methylacyl-CoA racemase